MDHIQPRETGDEIGVISACACGTELPQQNLISGGQIIETNGTVIDRKSSATTNLRTRLCQYLSGSESVAQIIPISALSVSRMSAGLGRYRDETTRVEEISHLII